jgi:DNA-binding MarR family transcriptional regulator
MNGVYRNEPHTLKNPAPTARQGQFLAYIYQYSLLNGCAPAEADMERYFQITPPSVHSMVLTLERRGFIRRVPGQARSITLTVPPESLPPLQRVQR